MVLCVWYMCVPTVCKHVHMWRTEADFRQLPQLLSISNFETESLTEPGTHQLRWLASGSRDLSLSASVLGLQSFTLCQLFRWGLGTQTQSLMLEQKVLYYWTISPAHHFWGFVTGRVSYTTRWLQIHYVAKDNLELLDSPATISWLLELCVSNMPYNSKDYKKE